MSQGFDYWKVLECTLEYNKSHYYAGEDAIMRTEPGYDAYAQTKDAQEYIRSHAKGEKPFLLVMAYGDTHFPHGRCGDGRSDLRYRRLRGIIRRDDGGGFGKAGEAAAQQ